MLKCLIRELMFLLRLSALLHLRMFFYPSSLMASLRLSMNGVISTAFTPKLYYVFHFLACIRDLPTWALDLDFQIFIICTTIEITALFCRSPHHVNLVFFYLSSLCETNRYLLLRRQLSHLFDGFVGGQRSTWLCRRWRASAHGGTSKVCVA